MKNNSKLSDSNIQVDSISEADELTKLAKLKDQVIITDSEFQKMKQQLLNSQ
jgi:hypothetical protein